MEVPVPPAPTQPWEPGALGTSIQSFFLASSNSAPCCSQYQSRRIYHPTLHLAGMWPPHKSQTNQPGGFSASSKPPPDSWPPSSTLSPTPTGILESPPHTHIPESRGNRVTQVKPPLDWRWVPRSPKLSPQPRASPPPLHPLHHLLCPSFLLKTHRPIFCV